MLSESLPRLKAPRDHGAILCHPPLAEVGTLLAANQQRLAAPRALAGRPLYELRELARNEAVAAACRYLEEAGEPIPPSNSNRLILAGHQPELFHPGVWAKNFALHALARRHGLTPLNLIVDNDTVKSTALRLPYGERIEKIAFDDWHSETPYEERRVLDDRLFADLPERAAAVTRDWPFAPMLPGFWREIRRQRVRTALLGECLAAARRSVERAWGLTPLEAPLSRLCRTEAFAWFAAHVLNELPRFGAVYNAAVRAYRERHGLRSPNHPVPDLAVEEDWLEAPFWGWRVGEPRRQRMWVRRRGDLLDLRAGPTIWTSLSGPVFTQEGQLRKLRDAGFKLRTRALTTTLFARLLLGDLFIHGIGGGKYDEVTDDILREFYEIDPPAYLVFTATLHLPFERFPEADAECRRLQHLERDLHWNPQRHLDGASIGNAQQLVAEKNAWIARAGATHRERQERFTTLRALTERIEPFVHAQQLSADQRRTDAERRRRLEEVRSSREYAFCLFPEEMLRTFMASIMASVEA